ncbi:MAG: DUF58 domain-containing protein [Spirochaetaceae bacterium]|jgi:uncharacterized protein (DUF58 family)|nr:DUF58 domain-containing protein [Spirochaetaceae bacterium]
MDKSELLEKIAVFPITARGLAEDLRSGAYRSVFRGNGIEFDEVRDYRPGDDVRAIDRNVSARFGRPYVKIYREEREFSLCVVLDQSVSMLERGVSERSRYEQALLAMCLLGFSAEKAGQQFGAVFFGNEVRQVWPCRQGTGHLLALVSSALEVRGDPAEQPRGTALGGAMRQGAALCKRRSLLVVISDFLAEAWEAELPRLCRAHDCVCVRIALPAEHGFPLSVPFMGPTGFTQAAATVIEDIESNRTIRASPSAVFAAAWKSFFEKRAAQWEDACIRAGAATLTISVDDEVDVALSRFFGRRRLRA